MSRYRKRNPPYPVYTVGCPYCAARPGQPCTTRGKAMGKSAPHEMRITRAWSPPSDRQRDPLLCELPIAAVGETK